MNKINLRWRFPLFLALVFLTTISAAYEVIEVQEGGTLSGMVAFSGADPEPQTYTIDKNADVCGGSQAIDFVSVADGMLADVVVYLEDIQSGKAYNDAPVEIEQNGCKFLPFVSVAVNGQDLTVHNLDAVAHNVHTYELIGAVRRTAFNVNQPDQGSVLTKTVKLRRGNAMKVECDQHEFMHGFVFVAKNPYYTIVSADGRFVIDGIPAGSYTVKAWHSTLGVQETSVEIESGSSAEIEFAFQGK
jgi:plastocyanin